MASIAGTGVFCLSLAILTFLMEHHWVWVCVGIILQGTGAGLFFPPVSTAGIAMVDKQDIGVFNGFSNMLGILSSVCGGAIIMSIVVCIHSSLGLQRCNY